MIYKKIQIEHIQGICQIYIGAGCLSDKALFSDFIAGDQVCIVTNACVADLYLDQLKEALSGKQIDVVMLPDGESYKTLDTFSQIIDKLCERPHHRDTTIIALGGGVVGDITGFAAACYHRGVAFIQVPTTLLAQVDSSIGGKTAVNHATGKNLIGAFHQPKAVVIDIDTLQTLPDRDYLSGLAEVVKAAIIKDAEFFDWMETHLDALLKRDKAILSEAIVRACGVKQAVVTSDEKESGLRAILNFGHTFGHAIEHNLGYGDWLHGEAVGLGMHMATTLSKILGDISPEQHKRINTLLERMGYATKLPASIQRDQMLQAMWGDKKVCKGQMRLILLDDLGSAYISDQTDLTILSELIDTYIDE